MVCTGRIEIAGDLKDGVDREDHRTAHRPNARLNGGLADLNSRCQSGGSYRGDGWGRRTPGRGPGQVKRAAIGTRAGRTQLQGGGKRNRWIRRADGQRVQRSNTEAE